MTDRPDLSVNSFTPEEPPPMKIDAGRPFGPENSRIPEGVREEWKRVYRAAFEEALNKRAGDSDPMTPSQVARQKANEQVLRVAHPQTYEEAMALPGWQILSRRVETKVRRVLRVGENEVARNEEVVTSELVGVTIDGKGFRFQVPEKQTAAQ